MPFRLAHKATAEGDGSSCPADLPREALVKWGALCEVGLTNGGTPFSLGSFAVFSCAASFNFVQDKPPPFVSGGHKYSVRRRGQNFATPARHFARWQNMAVPDTSSKRTKMRFPSACVPGRNRTCILSLGVRSSIH